MASTIKNPVGLKCKNDKYDVLVVQMLLNKFIMPGCIPPLAPLMLDGDCGNKTCIALYAFQNGILGWKKPDMKVDPNGQTLAALNGPLKWANKPYGGGGVIDIPTPSAPDDDVPKNPYAKRHTFWFGGGVKTSSMQMVEGTDSVLAYMAGMDPSNSFFLNITIDRQGWGAGWSGTAVAVFITGLHDPRDLKAVQLDGWDFSLSIAGKWSSVAKAAKNASWFKRMIQAARARHGLGAAEVSTGVTAIKSGTAYYGLDIDSSTLDVKILDIPMAGAGLEAGIYRGISRYWPFHVTLGDENV